MRTADLHALGGYRPRPSLTVAVWVHRADLLRMARPLWLRGLVAAVRETSVVFAGVLGAALGERVRWAPVGLVLLGVVLIRLA